MGEFGCQPKIMRHRRLFLQLAICSLTLALSAIGSPTLPGSKLSPGEYQSTLDANNRQQYANQQGGRLIIHDNYDIKLGKIATWSKEPSTQGPGKYHTDQHRQVIHETNTAILLTNGHQIKLYPLKEWDLIPSGGYYVIKSLEQFNLSDAKVIGALGRDSTFFKYLERKQRHIMVKLSDGFNSGLPRSIAPSILPLEATKRKVGDPSSHQEIVSEDELFSSDNSSGWKRPLISDVGYMMNDKFCDDAIHAANCLVVFWLDKQNKHLRYGSYKLTEINRMRLLSSQFDAHGNLKSLTDENKKTIWLNEFPPVDLCKEARAQGIYMSSCEIENMEVDRFYGNVRVGLRRNDDVIFSLDREKLPLKSIDINYHVVPIVSDVKNHSTETEWKHHCQKYWFDTKNVLYFKDTESQHVELVGRMSSKPTIRALDRVKLHRDTLFFNDLATRSIMSTNVTYRREMRKHGPYTRSTIGKRKFHTIQRLEPTHQVLIVEPLTIESFDVVMLDGDEPDGTLSGCSPRDIEAAEPRVINDDLSENITRHKIETGYSSDIAREVIPIALFVLAIILILFGALRRNQRVDKLVAAQYNEIQT